MHTGKHATTPVVFLAFAGVAIDNHLPLPRLAGEAAQLRTLFKTAEDAGKCQLELIENVTLTQILDTFQDHHGRIAVFHFAGHGDSYELLMEQAAGRQLLVDAGGLAAFLAEQPGLRLVLLNACRTQAQAAGLLAAGVPAVVATTAEVEDELAAPLAARFYNGLVGGASIASSLRAAQAAAQAQHGAHAESPWQLHVRDEPAGEWKLGDPLAGAPPWRVPFLRNDSFVGRDEDLQNLHAALTGSSTVGIRSALPASAAGLIGMGGIGKTQLAVEYCYRYKDSYPGGVFWLNAAADWREEFADLGAYLEPDLAGEPQVRRIRAAADYLNAHAGCLLVLDNVEDPSHIRRPITPDLIPADLRCRLLLTTRSRDLGSVRPVEVTVLPEGPALQLLLRAEMRQPVLDANHAHHGDARAIYRMLGGLPLALEIAGAFLAEWPQVSLADFRQRLHREGRLATLDAEGEELSPASLRGVHAAAVAATLGEQWDALATGKAVDEDARLLLRVAGQLPEAAQIPAPRLGLFAGLVEDDAPGKPNRSEQALRRLERASLIEDLQANALRLHPLVREFAEGKTSAEDIPPFRKECAVRLLAAYHQVAMLEQQCGQRGMDAIEQDLLVALMLLPQALEKIAPRKSYAVTCIVDFFRRRRLGASEEGRSKDDPRLDLQKLLRMVQHESHSLRGWDRAQQPALFLQQWHKRALISRKPQQVEAAAAWLARRAIPHLALQWTTAAESVALEHTLSGHTDPVLAVAVTSDGRRAVSASADSTLKVWDLASGAELHTLSGHTNSVLAVALTADGQRAVSASADNTLKVWNLASGAELHTLSGHTNWVNAVALTADGQRAVSASDDHTLKVWNLSSGAELHTLSGHTSSVTAVAATADGQRAVSASHDYTLKVWDLASGAELHTLSGHGGEVTAVALTADGQRAVSASRDHTLKVWDLASGAELHTLSGHGDRVNAVVVTVDGRTAVSASWDHTLKVWDLQSGAELHALSGHGSSVSAVVVTADGQRAVSASHDYTLKVRDLHSGAELHTLSGHGGSVNAVVVTVDGRKAVSASDDHTLKGWNLEKANVLVSIALDAPIACVSLAADGMTIVAGDAAGNVHCLRYCDPASPVR